MGVDYSDLLKEKLGYATQYDAKATNARLDTAKFEVAKTNAKKELEVQGVKFPVDMTYYYKAGDHTAADTLLYLNK